jgi:hypothetical protein
MGDLIQANYKRKMRNTVKIGSSVRVIEFGCTPRESSV